MSGFDRDAQLDEILRQIRDKRDEEDARRRQSAERATELADEIEEVAEAPAEMPEESAPEPQPEEPGEPVEEPEVTSAEQPDETPARRGEARSLRSAFGGAGDVADTGEINKSMLAPTLGADIPALEEIDEEDVPDIFRESHERLLDASEESRHPLFSSTATEQFIPPEDVREPRVSPTEEMARATAAGRRESIAEQGGEIERKGVLNVKENIEDEEFKTFFSNTVVIDSKPLSQRRQRPKRITDFVVGDEGGPVFEENADAEISEYRSDNETEEVMELLMDSAGKLLTRTVLTGLLSALVIVFNLLLHFKIIIPETLAGNLMFTGGVNAVLMLFVVVLNYRIVLGGLGRLFTLKASQESVVAFAALMALVEPVVMIATKTPGAGFSACVASAAVFFAVLGRRFRAKGVLQSFANISADYEKYATTLLDDDAFARRLTRELLDENPKILIKRKTGFTDDFLSHATSEDYTNFAVQKPALIVTLVALACGVITYLQTKEIAAAVRAVALAAALTAPFTSTLASTLPFDRMQRFLSRIGCVVPGFSAADEVVDANCVVLEGREVFPRGNVMLQGIKTFEKERIDRAILYAASVLIQSCDTMSHMFLNVIQNKTEMLYNVDNIVYEGGLGFSCWVGQTRLLIGTRELLESRDIEVPSRDYENRFTKSSTRDAIYLAVGGKLYAMFVVSYGPSNEVKRALRDFEREGINVLIRTRDFNITAEKIANAYDIPRSMVSVVSEHDMEELAKKTAYVSHTPSVFTHIGSLSSYVGGILSCYKLQGALKLATTVELVAMIAGALIALLVTFISGMSISMLTVFIFQAAWLGVTVLVNMLRRY